MNSLNPDKVLDFVRLVNVLKHSHRQGWVRFGVKNPETISGHMYAMGMMTFLLGNDSSLDRTKCLQLALVHDLAESIVGDITPYDNVNPETKKRLENDAIQEIVSKLDGEIGETIYRLYKEYEARETPEARFVKDLDRFDLLFTATEYEKRENAPGKYEEFFNNAAERIEHPFVKKLLTALNKQRQTVKQ